jgi:hypothetical protein
LGLGYYCRSGHRRRSVSRSPVVRLLAASDSDTALYLRLYMEGNPSRTSVYDGAAMPRGRRKPLESPGKAGPQRGNAPKGKPRLSLRSGLSRDIFFPGANGAKVRRSSLDVDRAAPIGFRIGKPRGRVLRCRVNGTRRLRFRPGGDLLGLAGGLCARVGERHRGWLDLHLILHLFRAYNQPDKILFVGA